jgi:hypothetical protein
VVSQESVSPIAHSTCATLTGQEIDLSLVSTQLGVELPPPSEYGLAGVFVVAEAGVFVVAEIEHPAA